MRHLLCLALLAGVLPLAAHAADEIEKIKTRTADSIGVEPEELTISDVTTEGSTRRYKAKLADGTTYRCSVEVPNAFLRFGTFGQADVTSAMCTKRPGSGDGPEAAKNPLEAAAAAQRNGK